MPSQSALIWAGASGAAVAAVGAAVLYATHPGFLTPPATPVALTEPAQPPARPVAPAATPPVASSPAASASEPAEVKPSFDVVSVEPSGDTVVAGRAAPNVKVALLDGAKTLAETTSDAEGQFVIIPTPLPPGDHRVKLSAGLKENPETSGVVPVSVAGPPPTVAAPPAPTSMATAAPAPAGATAPQATPLAPAGAAPVAIRSIEASASGGMVAKGDAAPNATVRLYVSGAYVGDAKTRDDGRWSLTIAHGMTPGAYTVRADEIDRGGPKVVARAEAPFTFPEALAAAAAAVPATSPPAVSAASPPAVPSPSDLVVDQVQTHHVERGHTLWGISQRFYGDGSRYAIIFRANANQIRDPNLIYPGQTLVVPKGEPKP